VLKIPNKDDTERLSSCGLVTATLSDLVLFVHSSFAEYFYTKMMTDIHDSAELRNALFALGYRVGSNIA